MLLHLTQNYWENRYKNAQIGWDIGYVSTPLKTYFNQLTNKELKILIPGGGNSYETEYLYNNGFKNVFLIDWAETAIENFSNRNPNFPKNQLIVDDFFKHKGEYDLIIEQTFFCAINPIQRTEYVNKVASLLKPKGKLVGLLFNVNFEGGPPFGGGAEEYKPLFEKKFNLNTFETCYNSIEPRKNSELFIICEKIETNA